MSGARLAFPENRHELLGGEGNAFDRQLPHATGSGAAACCQMGTDRQTDRRAHAWLGWAWQPTQAPPAPSFTVVDVTSGSDKRGRKRNTKPKALSNFPSRSPPWPGCLGQCWKRGSPWPSGGPPDKGGQNCLRQLEGQLSSQREAQQVLGFLVLFSFTQPCFSLIREHGLSSRPSSPAAQAPYSLPPQKSSCWDGEPSLWGNIWELCNKCSGSAAGARAKPRLPPVPAAPKPLASVGTPRIARP